jgi:hypothetical protein
MTVRELIKQLQQQDPDHLVYLSGYEGGINDATQVHQIRVERDHNKPYNNDTGKRVYGDHEDRTQYNPRHAPTTPGVYIA